MMDTNEIIPFFIIMEKNIHFLKAFYNSLNCKKSFYYWMYVIV